MLSDHEMNESRNGNDEGNVGVDRIPLVSHQKNAVAVVRDPETAREETETKSESPEEHDDWKNDFKMNEMKSREISKCECEKPLANFL